MASRQKDPNKEKSDIESVAVVASDSEEQDTFLWRKWAAVLIVWVIVTAGWVGLTAVFKLPKGFGREADISDEAFRLLMYLAAPVFAAVIAVLVVSVVSFRSHEQEASKNSPPRDGAPIFGHRVLEPVWVLVTTALALLLIVNPGITGLIRFFEGGREDHVVKAVAARWFWQIEYPEAGVISRDELVLPADRRTKVEVESRDVLHSFWIPALRIKVDAVPGRTTSIATTPHATGDMSIDSGLRLQCAELCGLQHSTMAMPVRIVTPEEFDRWLSDMKMRQEATRK